MEHHFAWLLCMSSVVIAGSLAYGAVYVSIKLSQIAKRLKDISKK